MIPARFLFGPDVTLAVGWALINFIWQGTALLFLLLIILSTCRRAVARYNWALATLVLMALSPVATLITLAHYGHITTPSQGFALRITLLPADPSTHAGTWIDWLVLGWLSGVVCLSIRALGGYVLAERLRDQGRIEFPPETLARFRNLRTSLRIHWPVRFFESALVVAPAVLGSFRPVVLVPIGSAIRFTSNQLDALVLHELGHIKRLDPFVNLFQIIVETLLFYHPAIWRVSKILRDEREVCCDEIAVSVCDDAVGYARILTYLETTRAMPMTAMAANHGVLKDRIARLLGMSPRRNNTSALALTAVGLMCLVGCIAAQGSTSISSAPASSVFTAERADTIVRPVPPVTESTPIVGENLPASVTPSAPKAQRASERAPSFSQESYIGGLKAVGLQELSFEDIMALKTHGVTPSDVAGYREASAGNLPVHDILSLKVQGVTPAFMHSLQSAGFKDLTAREYVKAKALGVTPQFIDTAHKQGFTSLTMSQLIGLRVSGAISPTGKGNVP